MKASGTSVSSQELFPARILFQPTAFSKPRLVPGKVSPVRACFFFN